MRTFREFLLTEEESPFEKADEVVDTIIRDCYPYLREVDFANNKNRVTPWRGRPRFDEWIKKMRTREKRTPQGMTEDTKSILEDVFEEKFGHPFRSKSFFASGNKKRVELFGMPAAAFPVGNFDYLWSPNVFDINEDPMFIDIIKMIESDPNSENTEAHFLRIKNYVEDRNFLKNENLPEAVDTGNEIMFATDYYYVINMEKYLKHNMERLIKERM